MFLISSQAHAIVTAPQTCCQELSRAGGAVLVEQLRKEWRARQHAVPMNHAPSFAPEGLVMGAGTVLVPAMEDRVLQDLKNQEARVLALLSAAYGRVVPWSALEQSAADFAEKLFRESGGDRKRIDIQQISRLGGTQ